jgi:hypothetical protein
MGNSSWTARSKRLRFVIYLPVRRRGGCHETHVAEALFQIETTLPYRINY